MYITRVTNCYGCDRLFTYGPGIVVSTADEDGYRRLLCQDCVRYIRTMQQELGTENILREDEYYGLAPLMV